MTSSVTSWFNVLTKNKPFSACKPVKLRPVKYHLMMIYVEEVDWRFVITNIRLYEITKSKTISEYYKQQQINWVSHVIRRENDNVSKILTFHNTKRTRQGRKVASILERAVEHSNTSYSQFLSDSFKKMNSQQVGD